MLVGELYYREKGMVLQDMKIKYYQILQGN